MRYATPTLATLILSLVVTLPVTAQDEEKKEAQPSPFKSLIEKVSYGVGLNIGRDVTREELALDVELLIQGIRDAAADKPKLSEDEFRAAMLQFQQQMAQQEAERRTKAAEENKTKGEAFLAKNKQREGVKATETGLQYEVIKSGDGKSPGKTDRVRTHYRGTTIDGTEFDSSIGGEPVEFPVNGVIAGWTEALQLMQVGDKWRLFIPSELAYGARGAGNDIGPNETLIFEVELLDVLE